jgi:hypothetical protein
MIENFNWSDKNEVVLNYSVSVLNSDMDTTQTLWSKKFT